MCDILNLRYCPEGMFCGPPISELDVSACLLPLINRDVYQSFISTTTWKISDGISICHIPEILFPRRVDGTYVRTGARLSAAPGRTGRRGMGGRTPLREKIVDHWTRPPLLVCCFLPRRYQTGECESECASVWCLAPKFFQPWFRDGLFVHT